MSSGLCSVENCTRYGKIELNFGVPHANLPGRLDPDIDYICEYHAQMCVELLTEMGHTVPIVVDAPARVARMPLPGNQRRYARRKPVDNADYDRRYGE